MSHIGRILSLLAMVMAIILSVSAAASAQEDAKVAAARAFVETADVRKLVTFCAHPASTLTRFEFDGVKRGADGFALTYVGNFKGVFGEAFSTNLVFRFADGGSLSGVEAGKSTCLAAPFSGVELAKEMLADMAADALELSKDSVFRKAMDMADAKTALALYLIHKQGSFKPLPAGLTDEDLTTLIRGAESMDEKARREWIGLLPKMTPDQRGQLRKILVDEREKLAAIDGKSRTAAGVNRQAALEEGVRLLDKGECEGALAVFNRVIDTGVAPPRAYMLRGSAHYQLQEYRAAVADYTTAIDAAPKDAMAYRNRAAALGRLRNVRGALADYARAAELEPKNPAAWNDMAWTLATCKDAKFRDGMEAIEHATKACELTDWKNPMYFDTLAAAYAEAGQFEKAVEWQSKALADPAALEKLIGKDETARARERLAMFKDKKPFRE